MPRSTAWIWSRAGLSTMVVSFCHWFVAVRCISIGPAFLCTWSWRMNFGTLPHSAPSWFAWSAVASVGWPGSTSGHPQCFYWRTEQVEKRATTAFSYVDKYRNTFVLCQDRTGAHRRTRITGGYHGHASASWYIERTEGGTSTWRTRSSTYRVLFKSTKVRTHRYARVFPGFGWRNFQFLQLTAIVKVWR